MCQSLSQINPKSYCPNKSKRVNKLKSIFQKVTILLTKLSLQDLNNLSEHDAQSKNKNCKKISQQSHKITDKVSYKKWLPVLSLSESCWVYVRPLNLDNLLEKGNN